jgi:uncharacterized protein (DUF302 family)
MMSPCAARFSLKEHAQNGVRRGMLLTSLWCAPHPLRFCVRLIPGSARLPELSPTFEHRDDGVSRQKKRARIVETVPDARPIAKANSPTARGEGSENMSNPDSGIVTLRSNHLLEETVRRIEEALGAKGVKLFALIDHSGEAEQAGMKMPPTKLLIFGHPKAGTPLMLASPSAAIDLPLKLLVAEDGQGRVWISYNSPSYLQARHNLPQELLQNIAVVVALAASVSE